MANHCARRPVTERVSNTPMVGQRGRSISLRCALGLPSNGKRGGSSNIKARIGEVRFVLSTPGVTRPAPDCNQAELSDMIKIKLLRVLALSTAAAILSILWAPVA